MHPQAGGAEVRIHELGKRLVKKGCRVRLVCERWPDAEEFSVIDGIEVVRIGGRYDTHLRVPFLLKSENYDVVVDDIAHAMPWFSPLFTTKPVIGQVHHIHNRILNLELPSTMANFISYGEKILKYIYQNLVVVSESTRSDVIDKYHFASSKIKVVPNGVDLDLYQPCRKSAEPTILWIGRVKRYKRVDHVLLAFKIIQKAIPNARLIIVGDGDYLPTLKRISKELRLSNVVFAGKVSEKDKVELMGSSWITVATSLTEGWCMTITESAACSSTAVAYDVAGLRDSVINRETGILTRDGDITALANAIIKVLEDEKYRKTLSKNAFNHAKYLDWNTSTESFLKILENLPTSNNLKLDSLGFRQFGNYAFTRLLQLNRQAIGLKLKQSSSG